MASGLERSSQSVRPSSETAGKMKRAAIDARTNPASTRLRNGTTFTRKNVIPSPLSGRYLMLKTYTTTSTASRISWLHCVVSVSYTHLRAHETRHDLVCRLLLEKKKK